MQAKILLIGETQSGKTSIIHRLIDNIFNRHPKKTVGTEFYSKQLCVHEKNISLKIWDTAGEERFQSLGSQFYRSTDAFVLVIDATQRFDAAQVQKWINETKSREPKPIFYVAINKCEDDVLHADFKDGKGQLDQTTIRTKLKAATDGLIELKDDAIFFCSAKTPTNIGNLFNKISQDYVRARNAENKENLIDEGGQKPDRASQLIDRLNQYTSFWNWLIAGLKWVFSLGQFSLGIEKQKLAEDLIKDLRRGDPSLDILVSNYTVKNQEAISNEYKHSWFFANQYVAKKVTEANIGQETSGKNCFYNGTSIGKEYILLNKGELGQILADHKAKTPTP